MLISVYILVGQNVHSDFSGRCYSKTQMNFLTNPIYAYLYVYICMFFLTRILKLFSWKNCVKHYRLYIYKVIVTNLKILWTFTFMILERKFTHHPPVGLLSWIKKWYNRYTYRCIHMQKIYKWIYIHTYISCIKESK